MNNVVSKILTKCVKASESIMNILRVVCDALLASTALLEASSGSSSDDEDDSSMSVDNEVGFAMKDDEVGSIM